MYYVKTVYLSRSVNRLPNISKYKTYIEAAEFISGLLKGGTNIISCELVDEDVAKHLLLEGKAETVTWRGTG